MDKLLTKIEEVPKGKRVIIFDLDGTLAESKAPIDTEAVALLGSLIQKYKVAVIGGGNLEQFEIQLLTHLPQDIAKSGNLFLLPLNGSTFYQCLNHEWQKVYERNFSEEEKRKIFDAFTYVLTQEMTYTSPDRVYGELIEDRGSQITFSAMGQQAPLEEKIAWSQQHPDLRSQIVEKLQHHLPEMEVKEAGVTSIDVTGKGIDKKFGIEQLIEQLKISKEDILFIGDDFKPDGNDHPALESGVTCFEVKSPEETKQVIKLLVE